MEHWLKIITADGSVTLNYGDKEPHRGATISGLGCLKDIQVEAWDIDENGKRWDK